MTNEEKILAFLKNVGARCDACILQKTSVAPHQQVNDICRRRLGGRGVVHREKTRCAGCDRHITVNHLIGLHRAAPSAAREKTRDVRAAPGPALSASQALSTSEKRLDHDFIKSSVKPHDNIWETPVHNSDNIPPEARRAFECIARATDGFRQITIGKMEGGPKLNSVGVKLYVSDGKHIDGSIFDPHAKKKCWQKFRVHVNYLNSIGPIYERIKRALRVRGLLRENRPRNDSESSAH